MMNKIILKELLSESLRKVNSFKRVSWTESACYESIKNAINSKDNDWKKIHFNHAVESITLLIRNLATDQNVRSSKATTIKYGDALLNLKTKINEILDMINS